MSISTAQNKVKTCRSELERRRAKQATEETRAARLDQEAARYEEQAHRASSPYAIQNKLDSAARKRADARRARDAAAKESKAVADAQKKLHGAEAALAKEHEREEKRAREKARREQRAEEQSRLAAERARDREFAQLQGQTEELRAQLRATPWAQSPEAVDVLFIAASLEDAPPLRLDKEVREIQRQMRLTEYRDAVQFHWRPAVQVTDLLQALNEFRPHIVHFSGHGSQRALIFEDDDGLAKPLSNSDLAQLLRITSDRIRLALFNSCESSELAGLACAHIDAAIGMDEPVDDSAAKIFAAQFYNALGFGKSLEEAFEQAKFQVALATGAQSGEPKLHTAAHVDAGNLYLVRPPGEAAAA